MTPRGHVIRAARQARELGALPRLLLLELAFRSDDDGNGNATNGELAETLGVTTKAVEKLLAKLRAGGWFARPTRRGWVVSEPYSRRGSDPPCGGAETLQPAGSDPTPGGVAARVARLVSDQDLSEDPSFLRKEIRGSDLVGGSKGDPKPENEKRKRKADPDDPWGLAPAESKRETADLVREVFAYWQTALGHSTAKLVKQRETKIRARLREGYTPEDLRAAIDGVKRSPWHMGENPDGRVYDDLVTIFRDGAQIEKFRALATGARRVPPGGGRHLQTNTGAFSFEPKRLGA